jgi:ATP:ADP antiporter, AAA family
MKQRLLHVLNIKASESNHVFDLLSIQLFIGIAHSFLNIVSFTFFIHHFAVNNIAYAYLVVAGFLLLLNVGYEKLEKKLSPLHLFRTILLLSVVILLFFRVGLLTLDRNTIIFALLVWGTLFYMMTGYAYWGLVSLLFNVRESRRVFAIVGSGDIPAKLIGYIAAPLLMPVIGIDNLLLFSVLSLCIGFFLVNRLIAKKRWEGIQNGSDHSHGQQHGGPKQSVLAFLLNNKLIFFISLLSLLSYNVFNLIDYTFVTEVKARVQNLTALATYISIFFAAGRIITLILKLVFTSRMIERLGLITCLMITPVMLSIFCLFFIFNTDDRYVLLEFGIMAILTEVLRSAMQEPVFFILFQPLSAHNRLKGHIIAKGYMLAPSLLIVGISLVVAQQLKINLSINFIIKVIFANLMVWAAVIFYIRKAYAKTLHHSIAKGVMNSEGVVIYNRDTYAILLERLESGGVSEKIYALKLLDNGKYPNILQLLKEQLLSNELPVKQYAFERLNQLNALNTSLLQKLIREEPNDELREMAAIALCKVAPENLQHHLTALHSLSPSLQKGLVLLLLQQKGFNEFYAGATAIQQLLQSADPAKRELALEIISECSQIDFTTSILVLLEDEDPSVRRNAFVAACKLKKKDILPVILEKLQHREDKYLAIQGLFQYGERLFEDLKLLPSAVTENCTLELVKIAAKLKGPWVTRYLLSLLQQDHPHKDKAIHVLWSRGYHAEIVEDIHLFRRQLERFIENGTGKISFLHTVPDWTERHLLQRSLETEIWNDLAVALKICVILYTKKEINRIIELTENKEQFKLYNSMEMLEMILPKKTARELNALFDFLLDPVLKKKHTAPITEQQFFRAVAITNNHGFNDWTKAVCVYSTWRSHLSGLIDELKTVPVSEANTAFGETKTFALSQIAEPHYADH